MLPNIYRRLRGLPRNNIGPTERTFTKGYAALEEAAELLRRAGLGHCDDLRVAAANDDVVRACCLFLSAQADADLRLGVAKNFGIPAVEIAFHVTQDPSEGQRGCRLGAFGPRECVVLLALAAHMYLVCPSQAGAMTVDLARRLAEECAAQMASASNWDAAIRSEPRLFVGMDLRALHFALAVLAVKATRRMWRLPDLEVNNDVCLSNDACPRRRHLLQRLRHWSDVQVETACLRAEGWANRAYHLARPGEGSGELPDFAAAAKAYERALEVADRRQDRFLMGSGRLQLAGLLVFGACGPSVSIERTRQLYRRAMREKEALEHWGMGAYIEVESMYTNVVCNWLQHHRGNAGSAANWLPTPGTLGIWNGTMVKTEDLPTQGTLREAASPSKKSLRCTHCATLLPRSKLKKCSRCRRVLYCSRRCQKSHWKKHKADCTPRPQAGCC